MKKIVQKFAWVCCILILNQYLYAQKLDKSNFDESVNPADDFFNYVNGGWLANNEIPASEGAWGSFYELNEFNREVLKEILDASERERQKTEKGSDWQLVGDFYASGMDIAKRNELGYQPIQEELNKIDQIEDLGGIVETIARHQLYSISSLFYFYATTDAKNSGFNAAGLWNNGLSLPNRSYYLEDNDKFNEIRTKYKEHIARMFEMIGVDTEKAQKNAETVFKIEERLAIAHRTPVQNRDPQRRYNKLTMEDLNQMSFNMDWETFFEVLEIPQPEFVLVGQPEFFAMMDRALGDFSVDEWKAYFQWKLINNAANYLNEEIEQADFDFYSTTLRGVEEMRPVWKRVQSRTNSLLGNPLGKLYVEKAFPPEAKVRMEEMIENIRAALKDRIQQLDWMGEETKQEAMAKLEAINYKIGYPDVWDTYYTEDIRSDDYWGNRVRIIEFDNRKDWAKIGQPVDPNEWGMTPPTVNAYYSPTRNEIVFPAGILQPPFFEFEADDAINYGAIGAVIGHEITHGFDDSGSQYDAEGNLRMWWTEEDKAKFEEKANMVVELYDSFTVLDTLHVNGKLTLGENIADLAGVTIAFAALQKSFEQNGRPDNKDGFTPEQRFFIGFARVWRSKYRDEVLMERVKTDPHSPARYRVNGTLSNVPAFFEAFNIPEGSPMRRSANLLPNIW